MVACAVGNFQQIVPDDSYEKALSRAGMASLVYKDRIILFGGRRNADFFNDVWLFDANTSEINCICNISKMRPRSYHSATLVGEAVCWLIGGGTLEDVLDDVWCYNLQKRSWQQPKLIGDVHLVQRTAHGACLHPTDPTTILLFGGFGVKQRDGKSEWLDDIVSIHTATGRVSQLKPRGHAPEPRAYHTFTLVGTKCYALFGRTSGSKLITSDNGIAIYDPITNKWLPPPLIVGDLPRHRSSHRVACVGNGLLMFGGACAGSEKTRLSDLHLLSEGPNGRLIWRRCTAGGTDLASCPTEDHIEDDQDDINPMWPKRRAGHAQEVVKGKLFIMAGYTDGKVYAADIWSAEIGRVTKKIAQPLKDLGENDSPVVIKPVKQRAVTRAAALTATTTQTVAAGVGVVAESQQQGWRSTRRTGAPVEPTGGGKRQRVAGTNTYVVAGVEQPELTPQQMQRELIELRAAVQRHKEMEAQLLRDKNDLSNKLKIEETSGAAAVAEWKRLANQCKRFEEMVNDQDEKLRNTESRIRNEYEARYTQLLRQRDDALSKARISENLVEQLKSDLKLKESDHQRKIYDYDQANKDHVQRNTALQAERDAARAEAANLQKRVQDINQEIVVLQGKVESAQQQEMQYRTKAADEHKTLAEERDKAVAALRTAEQQAESLKQQLAIVTATSNTRATELASAKTDLVTAQNTLVNRDTALNQLKDENEKLKAYVARVKCKAEYKRTLEMDMRDAKDKLLRIEQEHQRLFEAIEKSP